MRQVRKARLAADQVLVIKCRKAKLEDTMAQKLRVAIQRALCACHQADEAIQKKSEALEAAKQANGMIRKGLLRELDEEGSQA